MGDWENGMEGEKERKDVKGCGTSRFLKSRVQEITGRQKSSVLKRS